MVGINLMIRPHATAPAYPAPTAGFHHPWLAGATAPRLNARPPLNLPLPLLLATTLVIPLTPPPPNPRTTRHPVKFLPHIHPDVTVHCRAQHRPGFGEVLARPRRGRHSSLPLLTPSPSLASCCVELTDATQIFRHTMFTKTVEILLVAHS